MKTEPIWLSLARSFIGLQEIPGKASNPVILRWARDIGAPAWYENDDQAWCAVALNRWLMASQLPMAGRSFDLLRAKSFEVWGQALSSPALGAVLVFAREGGAHVGLYLGERADAYRVLGGNQGNAVSETWIKKSRLSAVRWPTGIPLPTGGRVHLQSDGSAVSTNEA